MEKNIRIKQVLEGGEYKILHPETAGEQILQDSNHRLVTDTKMADWDGKQDKITDENGKIPLNLLSEAVTTGGLKYISTFDPNVGYPSNPETGNYWVASADGEIDGEKYTTKDWAVFNGTDWEKVDNDEYVTTTVNGQTGNVDIPIIKVGQTPPDDLKVGDIFYEEIE